MIKVRFVTDANGYGPVVHAPKHPWWCRGYNGDGKAVIIAYADSEEQVVEYWPNCTSFGIIESGVVEYQFSSNFPKPHWFNS